MREVCERFGVASLEVFGSAARNEARPDADLLFVLKPTTRLGFGLFDLEDELAALLGRPVDLVLLAEGGQAREHATSAPACVPEERGPTLLAPR